MAKPKKKQYIRLKGQTVVLKNKKSDGTAIVFEVRWLNN
jgi:hypothetical protein